MKVNERIKSKGIVLPEPPSAGAMYLPCVLSGNLLFFSGCGTVFNGERLYTGKVGAEQSMESGRQAARICALNLIARLKHYLGDLDRVVRIVNLRGYVACVPEFTGQASVINGASEVFIDVFGEAGEHSRTAIGVNSLPNDITVEVDIVVEVS